MGRTKDTALTRALQRARDLANQLEAARAEHLPLRAEINELRRQLEQERLRAQRHEAAWAACGPMARLLADALAGALAGGKHGAP